MARPNIRNHMFHEDGHYMMIWNGFIFRCNELYKYYFFLYTSTSISDSDCKKITYISSSLITSSPELFPLVSELGYCTGSSKCSPSHP